MKGKFYRNFDVTKITKLKKENLYSNYILPDILKFKIFPAIRENLMDFYYNGGRLFQYDGNDFITHIKYASAIINEQDYIKDRNLISAKHIPNFSIGYNRIKENCSLYSGLESKGASKIYNNYSYSKTSEDIVVIDIEVSLKSIDNNQIEKASEDLEDLLNSELHDRRQDRIDILLYHKKLKELKFVELKHYSNKELWAKMGNSPKVCSQLKRYENQIKVNKSNIMKEYEKYIDSVNKLFNLTLPIPQNLCDNVTLLVFGYDKDQQKGKLNKLICNNPEFKNFKTFPIGKLKNMNINSLWKA